MTEPLSPEQLSAAGKEDHERGDFLAAAQAFLAAGEAYRLAGEALMAAEMDNNRCVSLLQAGNAQAALEAAEGTAEIFAAAGDIQRQALAYGNQAAALEALGRSEEAEQLYSASADLLAELGEDELRASVLRALSELQLRSGRHLEAVASMQAGLDSLQKPTIKQRLLRKLLQTPFNLLNRS